MTKSELAGYLVNLHTLMQAQTSNVSLASATLADEYEFCWKQLKEVITNEAGNRKEYDERPEAGADKQGDLSRRGQQARNYGRSWDN